MRIAATRSIRIYGLEGSIPNFKVVFIRFESRSTEVDRGRDSVWAISRRPEACRSSESHQNAGFSCSIPWKWSKGSAPEKIWTFGPDKDQNLQMFSRTNRLR